MRVPIRKGGQYTYIKDDPYMTEDKFEALKKNLEKLKQEIQPRLIAEVKRLALMGDFSENAAYQIAKGKLRGTNSKIDKLTKQIADANLIKIDKDTSVVQIGHQVTISNGDKEFRYRILGSSETNPAKGAISYQSPLGKALIGKKINDSVEIKLANEVVKYKIISIN